MTFSIVAYDSASQAWGIAVTSRIVACGAVVPHVSAYGAIATQALPDVNAGRIGLEMLARGASARATLDFLVTLNTAPHALNPQTLGEFSRTDDMSKIRQMGLVDRFGNCAAYTGADCLEWAGHLEGEGFCVQGNILVGEAVISAVAEAYRTSTEGDFARRLILALSAGYAQGGDKRTDEPANSAALKIGKMAVRYYGYTDSFIDLRVDNAKNPLDELLALREMHRPLEETLD